MKTPLKSYKKKFKSAARLKEIFPRGSVVESFLFFSGQLEFNLAQEDRFIIAHTDRYYVYEFWDCVKKDPIRLHSIIASDKFQLTNNQMLNIFQENWMTYEDPFVRAALFFILNNCSDTGLVSVGNVRSSRYSPFSLAGLRNFKMRDNFHLQLDSDFIEALAQPSAADYLLIPAGPYTYQFLQSPNAQLYELTHVDHRTTMERLSSQSHSWVLIYHYHPHVMETWSEYNTTMVNQYGRPTANELECEEIIVTNF